MVKLYNRDIERVVSVLLLRLSVLSCVNVDLNTREAIRVQRLVEAAYCTQLRSFSATNARIGLTSLVAPTFL
jgi:hypothetical protein